MRRFSLILAPMLALLLVSCNSSAPPPRAVTESDLARLPYRHATDVWPLQPDVEGRARLGAGPSTPAIDG